MDKSSVMLRRRLRILCAALAIALAVCVLPARGQDFRAQVTREISAEGRARVDRIAQQVLGDTGVPSASIAIVLDGQIFYVHAYGNARLNPTVPARPEMAYSIGSVSKQFTSTAMLMLAEQGKLSLDDKVAKYLPSLTRANEVTIRELLSHTSGYQDYWPQDYVPPFMTRPITATEILEVWARKPLDFDPGTKWQYSNTNYVIAGVIIEKVSGEPLLQFLQEHVFTPLKMRGIENVDLKALPETDATGYMRYALGPPRVAPKEGPGWLFAAGELAMPAEELAKWDIGILQETLLKHATYKEMETEVKLKDGGATGYALGLSTGDVDGHKALRHGGEVSGFTSQNYIFPDDHAAIVVLTNQDASGAAGMIGRQIASLILDNRNNADAAKLTRDRKIFEELQHGRIDRTLFTSNANAYFTEQALADYGSSLGALGQIQQFVQTGAQLRGGMIFRAYRVSFAKRNVIISIYEMPDGKIEQYLVEPVE
ncbi:MAG TPA: serine hydrolase domain-containing protein [Candidatus Acidoferrales bacterium]